MPIDASIPLQFQAPKLANPLEQYGQVLQIQNALAQNRLADLTYGEKQRQVQQTNALNDAYRTSVGSNGEIDKNKLYTTMASSGYGSALPSIQKSIIEVEKAANEGQKLKLESALKKLDIVGQVVGSVKDPVSFARANETLKSMGIPTLGDVYDPEHVRQMADMAVSRKDMLAQQLQTDRLVEERRHNRVQEGISGGNLAVARDRLAFDKAQPKGQVVTTADGGVVLVDPRGSTAQPVIGPDGQQVIGKLPGQLAPKQIADAQGKLQSVQLLRMQLENLKKARANLGALSQGPIAGRNPASEAGSNYDAALAALQTTVRQLTRTPGEGAMSDYESRLASAQLPNRADFASSIDQKIDQLEQYANTIENGYTNLLNSAPKSAGKTAKPAAGASPDIDALLKKYGG